MPTYLKHYYVDPVTGEAFTNGGSGLNGKTHPAIPGLDVKFWGRDENEVDVSYSIVDITIDPTDYDGVTILTESQFFDALEGEFNKAKQRKILDVYNIVKHIKEQVVDTWWHSSEISASTSFKLKEAEAAMAAADDTEADSVAPNLALEAMTRGVTTKNIAANIVGKQAAMAQSEALVSGHRGHLTDTIDNTILFDRTDIDTALASFGTIAEFDPDQGFDTIRNTLGIS